MHQTAKIFATGSVRLPEFALRPSFAGGGGVLSPPTSWVARGLNQNEDMLIERRQTHTKRDPFEGMEGMEGSDE
ncbi:MAG: hypothetical protein IPH64_18565 [Comamonadaceae bacterium]|nr:hypothetical protein [Comamonadaceae bacterium]